MAHIIYKDILVVFEIGAAAPKETGKEVGIKKDATLNQKLWEE